MPLWIHRMQRDVARRCAQRSRDEVAAEAHGLGCLVEVSPGIAVGLSGIGRQHLHPLRLEHDERGIVDGRYLIVGEHLERLEGVAQMPVGPRAVEHGVADFGARGAAPVASTGLFVGLFHEGYAGSWEKISIRKMTRPAACHYPICRSNDMPLSDTPVTRERSSRGGGTHHRLGEIIGAGSDPRELFGDGGLDVGIRGAGAARRGQRKPA